MMRSLAGVLALLLASAGALLAQESRGAFIARWLKAYRPSPQEDVERSARSPVSRKVAAAAIEQLEGRVTYDPAYFKLAYPGGDVPADRGVCTDVVIRAYRKAGVDLQVDVHEDMVRAFSSYPRLWGRREPDTNIDHRRVPNLLVFFGRRGVTLPITREPGDYRSGDIVAWDLGGGVTHTGLVVDRLGASGRRLIVHNIGAGPKLEDALFDWRVIGHFRYPK